jgi:hypothetical protein
MGEDLNALAPLFGKATESDSEPPRCDVLIVYARIDPSGKIAHSSLGLREMARDSGAKVVVVATENSGAAYIAAATRKAYGSTNLVMTLGRKGKSFSVFLGRLFNKMFAGETMPVAWVELAPQIPGEEHADAPEAIFAAELGQVTFR